MKKLDKFKRALPSVAVSTALSVMALSSAHAAEDAAGAGDFNYALSGYVRGWLSMNLENQEEYKQGFGANTKKHARGKLSMVRGSILLDNDASWNGIKFKAIARLDKEYKTNYLKDLEDLRATNASGPTSPFYQGRGKSITDNYNNFDFREFWVEAPIGDRTTVKFGRQQLVWGESDFFQAMDVVHGYNLSWRLFFEGENEEWRKPLILLSTKIRIPEANGLLAAYIRPGLDRCEDMGNTYDVRGGRWFFAPYRGFDASRINTVTNCETKGADKDKWTYGIRWQGEYAGVNYSVAYLKAAAGDPVVNSAIGAPGTAYKGVTAKGSVSDFIHPNIDVIGATVSGYSDALDAVLSAEMAYVIDQPYNVGTGAFNPANIGIGNPGLGLNGIKEKDLLIAMLRADKNLKFEDILGTTRPSFSSIQIFSRQIMNFKKSDDLARLFFWGTKRKENDTILTMFTVLNYKNDEINPGFAVGFDLVNGGGFAIPSVSMTFGDKWLAKLEADIFWDNGSNGTQFSGEKSQLFGYFKGSSQLALRVTRQF
jgi:hypothetical protein